MTGAAGPLRRTAREMRRWLRQRHALRLQPQGPAQGRVLLSYVAEPFHDRRRPLPTTHTHFAESVQIAQTFLDMGYRVDVIDYLNDRFIPRERYDVLVDPRHNMERLADAAGGDDCLKILHADTCHIAFQNAAEMRRLLDIQQRRGVTLTAWRQEPVNHALEHADACVYLGNEFQAGTYAYAGKPLHRARIGGLAAASPPERDHGAARHRFLWLGSWGLALKGLDLVLEAFAAMPDHELVVCGPIDREPDFAAAFARELWHTPNIDVRGWVDVTSPEFAEIVASCSGIVYASASEGASGAVINAMHRGLVPVVSRESSVDVPEGAGTILPDSSVASIRAAVDAVASRRPHELEEMSHLARKHVVEHHTAQRFAEEYRAAIRALLDRRCMP